MLNRNEWKIVRDAVLKRFIKLYFTKDNSSFMRYSFLYNLLHNFSGKYNIEYGKGQLTIYLRVIGCKVSKSNTVYTRKKIQGLQLNKFGIKLFGNDKNIVNIIDKNKLNEMEITHKSACVIMSCKPGRDLIEKICIKYDLLNYRDIIISKYKDIETKLYNINKVRDVNSKIALALYLSTQLNQKKCRGITNITEVSIRTLMHLLGMKKEKKVIKVNI